MKCFYHDDLDGNASAFCVVAWVGIHGPHDIENCLNKINYGMPFPLEIIQPDEQVWIVDYSISPDEMEKLLAITRDVVWIDHHKTAIDRYSSFKKPIPGYRLSGVAACQLTWEYVHWHSKRGFDCLSIDGVCETPQRALTYPIPKALKLTADRDVWDWKYGDETRFFYAGSQLHDTSPDSEFWWKCMEHEIEDAPAPNTGNREARIRGEKFWKQLIHDGETVEKFKEKHYEDYATGLGYDVSWRGHNCFAVRFL